MSEIDSGDEVKYIGDDDGLLRKGQRGRVEQKGDQIAEVDFGGSIGTLPIAISKLSKE